MSAADQDIRELLARYREGSIGEDEVLAHIGVDARSAPAEDTPPDLADLLDGYRAAEASGATTLEAWAGLTEDPALAGGLRTLAAREAAHAALLDRRVRELGREPGARIPDWLRRYNAALVDEDASDLDRLTAIVERFPDVEAALAPLYATIDAINDVLSRELLRAMTDDERVTLEWMHRAFAARRR